MSTFVVRFIGDELFQGHVVHATTQEEACFTSVAELLLFFEEVRDAEREATDPPPSEPHAMH
jgi:hypothetical protein